MVNRYLLDTHALLWWWTDTKKLSSNAYEAISNPDNLIFISSATVWEIATKHRKGKLGEAKEVLEYFSALIQENDFKILPIEWQHAKLAGQFTQIHQDPFDRMLVAQSILNDLILVSCDSALNEFPVNLYW